jgi:hypothetical protein
MFDKHIVDFNKNILGLRDFVDFIEPFLTEQQKNHATKASKLLLYALVTRILTQKQDLTPEVKAEFQSMKGSLDAEMIEIFKRPIEIEVNTEKQDEDGETSAETSGFILRIKAKDDDVKEQFENAEKLASHIRLLYVNSLISLLSTVEWFFSQILHYYYDKFPGSAGIQNKTMTLVDLRSFESVRDAEKFLVDTKIEEILRGSLESWFALLKSELNLKLGYLAALEDDLVEIYQRRNLFVHNGGVVNLIYLNKVKPQLRNVKAGQILDVNKQYLDAAISKFQKTFILIASELWKKLDKSDKKRGDVLIDIVYENLVKSRWDISEGLSYFIIHDAELQPIDKVVSQLNYWLCLKRAGRINEAKQDLDKVDYSDKKEIFQLGLFAIRDDEDEFFELLPVVLDAAQLNIERLEEFPIFEDMRKSDRYTQFKATSKHFQEPNKPIVSLE